jgi:hypothetical protein
MQFPSALHRRVNELLSGPNVEAFRQSMIKLKFDVLTAVTMEVIVFCDVWHVPTRLNDVTSQKTVGLMIRVIASGLPQQFEWVKVFICQLLIVRGVKDVMLTEIHASEQLVRGIGCFKRLK